jgi:restriction system protein
MNWLAYEHHVADVLRREGWTTQVTPASGDGGVDVIASRAGVRLGVQAKMYGDSGRRVNAQVVHELYGAATCQDCTEFMIATDGALLPDARVAAAKLGVIVRAIAAPLATHSASQPAANPTFASVWNDRIVPLAESTVTGPDGKSNEIIAVDGGGILRRTSGRTKQRLEVEIFQWTIERLLRGDTVTLREINDEYPGRGSSGIARILGSLDLFEPTKLGKLKALRLAPPASAQ